MPFRYENLFFPVAELHDYHAQGRISASDKISECNRQVSRGIEMLSNFFVKSKQSDEPAVAILVSLLKIFH